MFIFGVMLFFTLSGCTLYLSNSNKISSGNLSTFYLKRLFRIWPAYIASLLLYLLFRPLFNLWYSDPTGHWIEKQFMASFNLSDFISYITLTSNLFGERGLFNNAYWSLPVEFQYYLLFPLAILLTRHLGTIGPIFLALLLYSIPKTDCQHPSFSTNCN